MCARFDHQSPKNNVNHNSWVPQSPQSHNKISFKSSISRSKIIGKIQLKKTKFSETTLYQNILEY